MRGKVFQTFLIASVILFLSDEIKRSSQLRTLLKRVVVNRTWKKFRPLRDLNPWPLRYRCSALPIKLTSQLGAGQWIGSKQTSKWRMMILDIWKFIYLKSSLFLSVRNLSGFFPVVIVWLGPQTWYIDIHCIFIKRFPVWQFYPSSSS